MSKHSKYVLLGISAFVLVSLIGVLVFVKNSINKKTSDNQITTESNTNNNSKTNDANYTITELKFGAKGTVNLYFVKDTDLSKVSWIGNDIKEVPFSEGEEDKLFKVGMPGDVLYNPTLNTYYILEPGGFETFSIVDKSVIDHEANDYPKGPQQDEYDDSIEYTETCEKGIEEYKDVEKPWSYVKCSTTVHYKKENFDSENGYTKTCFIPVSDNDYLKVDIPSKPIGSEVDACEFVHYDGLRGATLVK